MPFVEERQEDYNPELSCCMAIMRMHPHRVGASGFGAVGEQAEASNRLAFIPISVHRARRRRRRRYVRRPPAHSADRDGVSNRANSSHCKARQATFSMKPRRQLAYRIGRLRAAPDDRGIVTGADGSCSGVEVAEHRHTRRIQQARLLRSDLAFSQRICSASSCGVATHSPGARALARRHWRRRPSSGKLFSVADLACHPTGAADSLLQLADPGAGVRQAAWPGSLRSNVTTNRCASQC